MASVQSGRTSKPRPGYQSLSKNIAKPNLRGEKRSSPGGRPSAPLRQAQERRPPASRDLQPTQGRMSRTGKSVLTAVPIEDRNRNASPTKTLKDFDELGLRQDLLDGMAKGVLAELEYLRPTTIQALAIPRAVQDNRDVSATLLAAETGSGKTLAYLLPLFHRLKQQEQEQDQAQPERRPGRPRAVILVPSVELVRQVGVTVKALAHHSKLSSAVLQPRFGQRRAESEVLDRPIDVLVATPFQLRDLVEENVVKLDNVDSLVVDEADTLFDKSFVDCVKPLMKRLEHVKRAVLCSATIPRSLDALLRVQYPDIDRIVSPKVHTVPRRVSVKFVDIDKEFAGNKQMALYQIVRDISLDGSEPGKLKKAIVFVNKRDSIDELVEFLISKDMSAIGFSRDLPNRQERLKDFLKETPMSPIGLAEEGAATSEGQPVAKHGQMQILVTTDLASRGIDTTTVKTVILYESPHSTIDVLHRLGRTGRAGRRGNAYILLSKKRGNQWMRDIKEAIIRGQPLV